MATLSAHGIEARLPPGFEGRIYRRVPVAGASTYAVAHFCTFPLPADTADFGGAYVDDMGPDDVFAVLFEYGPESLGKALFARQGMPRTLAADDFKPYVLRRGAKGQGGTQWFFTEAARPFTLYVVIGLWARRRALTPLVNALLSRVVVGAAPLVGAPR